MYPSILPRIVSLKTVRWDLRTGLERAGDPNSIYYTPYARYPAYHLLDVTALLRSSDAAV